MCLGGQTYEFLDLQTSIDLGLGARRLMLSGDREII